jgi:predicted transcriptional regulator
MTKKNEKFIPNSFQVPNIYIDEYLHMLSNSEIKVLLYAMRRIFGFQKRTDRISISQFCDGVKNKDGDILDRGTGLSPATVIKSLDKLIEYGLIIKVADNNRRNEGTLYQLSTMPDVDDETIQEEYQEKQRADKERMKKVRKGKDKKEKEGVISNKEPYIEYNTPLISNITPLYIEYKDKIQNRNTEENQVNQAKPDSKGDTHKEVVGALMEVTKLDMKIKTNAGRIYKVSKELRDADYGVDDILEFGRQWKHDWRYKADGKPPLPETILKEICHVKKNLSVEERKRIAMEQMRGA